MMDTIMIRKLMPLNCWDSLPALDSQQLLARNPSNRNRMEHKMVNAQHGIAK